MPAPLSFTDLRSIAEHLRNSLGNNTEKHPDKSHFALVYAFNATGKTRLSGEYRDLGKVVDEYGSVIQRDTLYFNAYTEDLFTWDNDLEDDHARVLELNNESRFFDGLRELDIEAKIEELLDRYVDFQFSIDYDRRERPIPPDTEKKRLRPAVTFFRERTKDHVPIPIKVSRAEESIFVWCFFLATLQLALDGDPAFSWVKHVFIDDPISSLDEHNAIVVGNHLVQLYREAKRPIPAVASTHHALFFNVMHYELKNRRVDEVVKIGEVAQYNLKRDRHSNNYVLTSLKGDTPQFYHVSALADLCEVARRGGAMPYHFNVLRTVLEKTAFFLGYGHFGSCIKRDAEGNLHQRLVDILSHGKYSMYDASEMGEQAREYFLTILKGFVDRHPFNRDLVKELPEPKL